MGQARDLKSVIWVDGIQSTKCMLIDGHAKELRIEHGKAGEYLNVHISCNTSMARFTYYGDRKGALLVHVIRHS